MAGSLISPFSHIPKVAFEFFHYHKEETNIINSIISLYAPKPQRITLVGNLKYLDECYALKPPIILMLSQPTYVDTKNRTTIQILGLKTCKIPLTLIYMLVLMRLFIWIPNPR